MFIFVVHRGLDGIFSLTTNVILEFLDIAKTIDATKPSNIELTTSIIGARPDSLRYPVLKYHFRLNQKIRFLIIPAIIFVFLSPALLAESINSYCIVQKPVEEGERYIKLTRGYQGFKGNISVEFEANGEQYRIDKFDGGGLTLYHGDAEQKLMSVAAKQYEYFREIYNISLGKNGWIWIDGGERDYMAYVDKNSSPPTISNPEEISFLTQEPCSDWDQFWMEETCFPAQSNYSQVLDRIFVKGYRISTPKNTNQIAMQIIDGKRQLMPEALRNAKFHADVPQLNGALFRGSSEEALFYDGYSVTNLLEGYDIKSIGTPTRWILVTSKNSDQVFLNTPFTNNHQFLIRINKDLTNQFISLSDKKTKSGETVGLHFYIFPDEERLWFTSFLGIGTKVDGKMRYVAIVSEKSIVRGSRKNYQTVNGDIRFIVEYENTNSELNYLLVRKNDAENCEFDLSEEEAVVLDIK